MASNVILLLTVGRVSFTDRQLYAWLYIGFWNWLFNGAFRFWLHWKAEMFDLTRVCKWANHFRLCLWLPPKVSLLLKGIRAMVCISLCVFQYTRNRNVNLYEVFGSNYVIPINILNQHSYFPQNSTFRILVYQKDLLQVSYNTDVRIFTEVLFIYTVITGD